MRGTSWLWNAAVVAVMTTALLISSTQAFSKRPTPTPVRTATPTATPTPETKVWNFDQDKPHQGAKGWKRIEGYWEILPDGTAPSPPNTYGLASGRFLRSLVNLLNYFPLTVVDDPTEYDDFTLEVDFKTKGGRLDCSGGLVFRYVDPKTYYVLKAGCPDDFFELRFGDSESLKRQVVPIDRNVWYHLKVVTKEDHFSVYFADKFLFDVTDKRIRKGRIGLWAQDDSQPRFDNLKLTLPLKEMSIPMSAPPAAMPSLPGPGGPSLPGPGGPSFPGPGPGSGGSGVPPQLPPRMPH
jgi:hypothetical protein